MNTKIDGTPLSLTIADTEVARLTRLCRYSRPWYPGLKPHSTDPTPAGHEHELRAKLIRQILADASMAIEEKISGMSQEDATAFVRNFRIEVKAGTSRPVAREKADLSAVEKLLNDLPDV
ncbi:MAG TPA: hypothetical protein VL357_01915 [Rariglobus sp.]|jgi:hypothetical protein|nr:hypothetical protein [Rariglobus sp.]